MKKVLGAALLCAAMQVGYAQFPPQSCAHKDGISIQFTSYEAPNWDYSLVFDLYCFISDTIELDDSCLVVTNPATGLTISLSDTFDTLYTGCDTLIKPITIDFDTTALPYSYTKVNIAISYKIHGHEHLSSTDIYLYFTPWRTVEVWNRSDFAQLKRVWEHNSSNTTAKPYINVGQLPATNIPTGYEILEDWQETQYEETLEGLAFGVPMLAIHPDSLTKDDSTASNKKAPIYRYNGNATGSITGLFRLENAAPGQWRERPLCGLRVELWNRGGIFPMAVGATDMDGNYDLPFDEWKSSPVMQVSIKVLAQNDEHDIRGYSRFPFKWGVERESSDRQWLSWSGTNNEEDVDFNNQRFDVGTFRGVSQSFLAWEMVENETDHNLADGLHIGVVDLPDGVGATFFWPDALCANVPNNEIATLVNGTALGNPSIFLAWNEDENTILVS